MKHTLGKALTVALALICAITCENSVYSQSKETTVIEQADVDNPDLRHTLEIYPTEIYYGDAVYFSTYVENVSPKAVYVNRCHPMNYVEFAGRLKISSSLSEQEYTWILENPTGLHMDFSTERTVIPPGEKIYSGSAVIEFPPLEDWNDPFWKEIREKLSPEGVVCQFHIADEMRRELLTQDILIKPRPEEETALLDKWFNETPAELFPKIGFEKWSSALSLGRDVGGFIVVGGKEYNPVHFVRTSAFRKPFIPNNPTTLEGWRELETKFCDSTLRDDIKFTRLLLEYFEADNQKADQAKKELTDWIESLPPIQRSHFRGRIVEKGIIFFYRTDFADRNRDLMEFFHVADKIPSRRPSSDRLRAENMAPTEEEITKGSKTLQDGYRMWVYNGPICTLKIAAQLVDYNGIYAVTLKYRDQSTEVLRFEQFCKEDQKYIREMKSKNPSGGLSVPMRKR